MTIPFIGDLIREVGVTVRELIPDPDKRAELELKMAELADQADARENELLVGQIEVNKIEAGSSNLFVAGWRPFIGWTSGAALGYTWILAPILQALFHLTNLPALPAESIFPVVLAMLGISASRTFEKVRGVATSVGGRVLTPQIARPAPETSKSRWIK